MKKILYFLVILIIVAPIHLIEAQNSQKNKYKTSKIRDLALIYQGLVIRWLSVPRVCRW